MNIASIVQSIEASGLAEWMRGNVKAMPIVEFIHVLCAATVFGTVLIVDLRLLGYPDLRRAFTRVADELLRLTWVAFAISVVTGAMMFAPNAHTYVGNWPFRLKLLALLGAGINMAIFQFITFRSVATWDQNARAPAAARAAGAASILIWLAVIFLARWIGFTKGYNFAAPEDVNFSFE